MVKKIWAIEGLDCANCGAKLERAVAKIPEAKAVSVDFMSKKMVIEAESESALLVALEKARAVVKKLEPNVLLKDKEGLAKRAKQDLSPLLKVQSLGACDCGHDHDHGAAKASYTLVSEEPRQLAETKGELAKEQSWQMMKIGLGALIFLGALIAPVSATIQLGLFLLSFLIVGGEIVWRAVKNILRGQVFDENFLMSIATIGAFAIGEYPEGVAVMLFYQVGELFQSYAVARSRKSIADLMDIRPDYANLKQGANLLKVIPEEVMVGDLIVIKAGEKVPLDGLIVDGHSMLDTKALTGESAPRTVEVGDEVLSGCINTNGLITVAVSKIYGESTVAKILDLVENASNKKANAEQFITKFARYYTPIVVVIAAILAVVPPLVLTGATFSEWFYRALVFLVISCPCALVISVPLSFFGGLGAASKCGILIKGSNYLEALAKMEIGVFDKTGTLTKGVFQVTEIKNTQVSQAVLLEYAAYAESYSNHPISKSLLKAYGQPIAQERIGQVSEVPGHGVKSVVDGKVILAGNGKLMTQEGIAYEGKPLVGTVVHVAIDGDYAGYIIIADEVKADAKAAIDGLRASGVEQLVMLTGDAKNVGELVAGQLGLDRVYAELLPGDKVEKVEALLKEKSAKGTLIFVGDGINDAPVLARADVGVAMGGLGSDAAIEAADVVIMTDEPSKLATAVHISRKTLIIVKQNIVFALGIKFVVLILGAMGMATMWEAVFADVGVSVLAILNAVRVLNVKAYK